MHVPCTYDFEVAAAKYFHSLDDGEVPLLLLFSGTAFFKAEAGFTIEQVPWHKEAAHRLPVRVWRELMDLYFPNSAWIRLRKDTLDALQRYKSQRAIATWEETLEALLANAGERSRVSTSLAAWRWPARWPTPCSTRATSSTRTGRRPRRTRCGGSGAWSCPRRRARRRPSRGRPRPSCSSTARTAPTLRVQARCLQLETRAGDAAVGRGRRARDQRRRGPRGAGARRGVRARRAAARRRAAPGDEVTGRLTVTTEVLPGPYGVTKVRVRLENLTPWQRSGRRPATRSCAARSSAPTCWCRWTAGRFLSLVDPPEWARAYVEDVRARRARGPCSSATPTT